MAANTSTAPSANTSAAPVTAPRVTAAPVAMAPVICSGAMNPGVPMTSPAPVSPWSLIARAIPKSMTLGPSAVISTFDGLRSRWTSPARWTASSASASAAPRDRTAEGSSGPVAATACRRVTPGRYAVASQGREDSGSASSTAAVYAPVTARAAAASRRNRSRKCGSAARCSCTVFTATVSPPGVRPR